MYNHLFQKVTTSEKVEVIDYLETQSFDNKPSKNKLISLINIPKATYYAFKNHKPSKTEIKRNEIKKKISDLFYDWKEIYGAPKLYKEYCKLYGDKSITERTMSVYMTQMGLKSITVPKFKSESKTDQQLPFNIPMVNYLKESRPETIHTHVVTDITYIYTLDEGWSYLLTYMDLYTRKILVWDLSKEMTASWVTNIAKQVIRNYPTVQYIHSDRGSQYTSKEYLEYLLTNGVSPSFSSKGYPYHNAWIESFHAQIKKEYIYRRTIKDVPQAKEACFNYIEGFYNTIRSQKALGYKSPNEFETETMELRSA